MNFRATGEEIVKRKQEAMTGFQKTFINERTYNAEDIRIKNEWVVKIEQANMDFVQWLHSIPTATRVMCR